MLGKTICVSLGSWTRVDRLGKGTHGEVYLATPTIGPIYYVAVKAARMERSTSLKIEKNILQHFIGCPEIVQCFGSEITLEDDNHIYYNVLLEYADGGTLGDLIRKQKKLAESEVKEYLRMILRGLSCIHGQGFVHGDLKPANILAFPQLDGKIKLKIADFGLSVKCVVGKDKAAEYSSNSKSKIRGTPIYVSPESVVFGKINPPLDIWSLGCILVEMITGKRVWESCKNSDEIIKKLRHEMELPADVPEELSREGRDFLASCLDYDYERRWTADELLEHPYLKEENDPNLIYRVN